MHGATIKITLNICSSSNWEIKFHTHTKQQAKV